MKSIISLLLCSLLIGCATSQATEIIQKPILTPPQETQQKVRPHGEAFLLPKNVICNDSKVMYDLLKSEPGPQVPVFSGLIRTPQGDVNGDGAIDVLDIVIVIGIIIETHIPTDDELSAADINGDGIVDILDIVLLVNTIVGD